MALTTESAGYAAITSRIAEDIPLTSPVDVQTPIQGELDVFVPQNSNGEFLTSTDYTLPLTVNGAALDIPTKAFSSAFDIAGQIGEAVRAKGLTSNLDYQFVHNPDFSSKYPVPEAHALLSISAVPPPRPVRQAGELQVVWDLLDARQRGDALLVPQENGLHETPYFAQRKNDLANFMSFGSSSLTRYEHFTLFGALQVLNSFTDNASYRAGDRVEFRGSDGNLQRGFAWPTGGHGLSTSTSIIHIDPATGRPTRSDNQDANITRVISSNLIDHNNVSFFGW